MKRVVEAKGNHNGREYMVTLCSSGFRCGYINVDGTPWANMDCNDECLYNDFDCHGGVTFLGELPEAEGTWLGWDYAHNADGLVSVEELLKYFPKSEIPPEYATLVSLARNNMPASLDDVTRECWRVINDANRLLGLERPAPKPAEYNEKNMEQEARESLASPLNTSPTIVRSVRLESGDGFSGEVYNNKGKVVFEINKYPEGASGKSWERFTTAMTEAYLDNLLPQQEKSDKNVENDKTDADKGFGTPEL